MEGTEDPPGFSWLMLESECVNGGGQRMLWGSPGRFWNLNCVHGGTGNAPGLSRQMLSGDTLRNDLWMERGKNQAKFPSSAVRAAFV